MVVSVPDSSTPAAIGYAWGAKIPFGEGLIKNRYIHRTFIQPDQRLRDLGVKMKLNPLREEVEGKKVVMVDDSIVRGTTSSKIVKILKDAGASEVHIRVSSPPIRFPCFYGIDMATSEELIASTRNIEEIRKNLGADSLAYLSIDGLLKAVDLPQKLFCLACFNDDYPIKIPKQLELGKFTFEREELMILKR
jgi:amidophosphoribosyltransferase